MLEEKLKKPFRFCNRVRLSYARKNNAFFEIELFSSPMRMGEDKAHAEIEGIVEVLRQKYGEKQKFIEYSSDHCSSTPCLALNGQSFVIHLSKVSVDAKATLKGPNTPKDDAYVFTVTLTDSAVRSASLMAPASKVDKTSGASVL